MAIVGSKVDHAFRVMTQSNEYLHKFCDSYMWPVQACQPEVTIACCFHPVSNWGPFACEANVITTTLWKPLSEAQVLMGNVFLSQ